MDSRSILRVSPFVLALAFLATSCSPKVTISSGWNKGESNWTEGPDSRSFHLVEAKGGNGKQARWSRAEIESKIKNSAKLKQIQLTEKETGKYEGTGMGEDGLMYKIRWTYTYSESEYNFQCDAEAPKPAPKKSKEPSPASSSKAK